MSSLWKKLKGNNNKSDQQSFKSSDNNKPVRAKEKTQPLLISAVDEIPYLTALDSQTDDPLLAKSQIIKNFDILLKESSTYPHFIEFLQACEVDHFAECWIECDKFRALALSLLKKYTDKEQKNVQNLPCTSANQCRTYSKRRNSKNSLNQNQLGEYEKTQYGHTLPDLVSNIPNDVSVTPLPSPEEPNPVKDGDVTPEIATETTLDNCKRLSETELKSKNDYNDNFDNLNPQTEVNSNYNLSFISSKKERLRGFATQIYNKFIDVCGSKYVDLPEVIRAMVLDTLMSTEIESTLFSPVQQYLYTYLEKEYFPKYLESEYFFKQIVEVFTSQRVLLQDILSCESAMPYFMEYMEQEDGQSLLEFWISAFNFKQHLQKQKESHCYNADEAQADAMVLYDKYFSLQATHKLGFSDQVRFLVECNICQENGPLPQCFDVPLRIVLSVIQREFLCGYISSTLHINFISELINTMKITTVGRKKRTASGSTCRSEESSTSTTKSSGGKNSSCISETNTLLAMDSSISKGGPSPNSNKLFKHLDDPTLAMRIDATHIFDPDSLWRRKNFTKLSCGFVDELGRFESDLQPEPDRRIESRLSKTLKKLIKVEENKVKEDMAYKVAEMIIKDVTNVTLGETLIRPRTNNPHSTPRPLSCTEEQLGGVSTMTFPSGSSRPLRKSSSAFFSS